MSDLIGSTDWIRHGDNFCVVLGDSQLAHFQDCVVQAAPEENLKLYAVLGRKAGSLRANTVQCNSARVRLKEGYLVEIFSRKMAKCESK